MSSTDDHDPFHTLEEIMYLTKNLRPSPKQKVIQELVAVYNEARINFNIDHRLKEGNDPGYHRRRKEYCRTETLAYYNSTLAAAVNEHLNKRGNK